MTLSKKAITIKLFRCEGRGGLIEDEWNGQASGIEEAFQIIENRCNKDPASGDEFVLLQKIGDSGLAEVGRLGWFRTEGRPAGILAWINPPKQKTISLVGKADANGNERWLTIDPFLREYADGISARKYGDNVVSGVKTSELDTLEKRLDDQGYLGAHND